MSERFEKEPRHIIVGKYSGVLNPIAYRDVNEAAFAYRRDNLLRVPDEVRIVPIEIVFDDGFVPDERIDNGRS